MEQPSSQHAQPALPFQATHCSIVAWLVFPEMHPRGAIRSPGKGAGTFLAVQRSCRGSARNWGSCWALPGRRKIEQAAPKAGLCLTAQLQELLSLCRALFANPAAELPCPGTSSSFVLHQQILNKQPGGLGWGKDPAGGAGKYLWEESSRGKQKSSVREREFPPHREVVFDQGLSRLESPTLHKHINTTQPAQGFLQFPAGHRSCTHRAGARADPGTAHPTPKRDWGDPQASRVLQSGGPVPPGWPCHLSPAQPPSSRGTRASRSKAPSSLPAFPLLSCWGSQGSCRLKASLFPRASPCFPPPSQSRAAMLGSAGGSWIKGSARMDLAGLGWLLEPQLATALLQLKAQPP